MDTANLIKMANQVGQFFAAYPDHAEAVAGIRTHIQRFWTPAMRTALSAHLAEHGEQALDPLVGEACRKL